MTSHAATIAAARGAAGDADARRAALRRAAAQSFLAALPAATLEPVLMVAELHLMERPGPLFAAGEVARTLYLVIEGGVELYGIGAEGGEVVLDLVAPVELVAAWAPLLGRPHALAARTLRDTRLLALPAAALRAALARESALADALLTQLCGQAEALMRQVGELKLLTTTERVARYLLARAPAARGRIEIALPFRKQLIAAQLGMTPESLSRAFAQLKPLGVTTAGQRVAIADPERLRRFCRSGA